MKVNGIKLTSIILWAILLTLLIPYVPSSNSEGQVQVYALTLYLYGDDPVSGDTHFSSTEPTGSGNSTSFPSSGGTFVVYELGYWNTQPLSKPLTLNGIFSISLWLVNDQSLPASVELSCDLRINDQYTGITITSDETTLPDSPQEFTFVDFVTLDAKKYDRLGIRLLASYQGTGFTFHWGDVTYKSKISAYADWLGIGISHPVVDEGIKTATIEANLNHIFGYDETVDYTLNIEGPTQATSISGPTIGQEGEIKIVTWVWNYGADGGYVESEYKVLVTILDRYGNYWNHSMEFYLTDQPVSGEQANWYLYDMTLSSNGEDMMPSMIIDDEGKFWVAYSSNRDFSWVDVYVESSTDGRTWTLEARITEDTAYDVQPSLMQDSSGTYWLAWQSDVGGDYQILMSSSSDGTNWDTPYQAFVQPDQNMHPCLIQDNSGTYWMAWRNLNTQNQYDIFVSSSSNGILWSAPQEVSTASLESEPSLIQDSEGIFRMVWFSGSTGHDELWQGESLDGSSWTINQITNDAREYGYPCLIQNSTGGFDITYTSDRSGIRKIYHMSSSDGTNWDDDHRIGNYTTFWITSLLQDENGTMWMAFPYQVPDSWNIWILSSNWSNSLPDVRIQDIPDNSSGDIFIDYILRDLEGDLVNITVEYSLNGRDFYPATMGVGGSGTTYLPSSREGSQHEFVWDSQTDLYGIDDGNVYFKITPSDEHHLGFADTSDPFSIDNNMAPLVQIETPFSEQNDLVTINFTLYDEESDLIDIIPNFSLNGIDFSQPTISTSSQPLTNLASSPIGITHSIIWDSMEDLPGGDYDNVYFSINPYDPQSGSNDTIGPFHIDNNEPPSVSLEDLQGVYTGDISISYTLLDEESDNLRIEVYYRTDGSTFDTASKGAGGDPLSGLFSSATGIQYEFIWDSKKDLKDKDEDTVYIKILPYDLDLGVESTTKAFHVDNKAPSYETLPEVSDITDTQVTISWSSDEPARYRLYCGIDNDFIYMAINDALMTSHIHLITDREPGTEYMFYIEMYDEYGNGPGTSSTYSFTTLLTNNPPLVSFEFPSDEEEVSGVITVSGTASDSDDGVEILEIRIDDGEWIGIYVSEFWTYDLDTKDLSNGEHRLYVRAFDSELNSDADYVDFYVNNEKEEIPDDDPIEAGQKEDLSYIPFITVFIIMVILVIIIALLLFNKNRNQIKNQ